MTDLSQAADVVKRLRAWADVLAIPSGGFVNDDLRQAADLIESLLAERADRNAVIEECAKVADEGIFDDHALAQATDYGRGCHHTSLELAAGIRALKSQESK